MLLDNGSLKCDVCGRFIPLQDLVDKTAIHKMITPSSALTWEEWDTVCRKCLASTTHNTGE
jgi:ribosomal protein S26